MRLLPLYRGPMPRDIPEVFGHRAPYRPIDTAAIARDVKAGKDECKIPGVRVFSRIEVR